MAKKTFKVNGKEVTTLKAVAAELGKKRVDYKDLAKFGVIEVIAASAIVETESAVVSAVVTTETEAAVVSAVVTTETEAAVVSAVVTTETEAAVVSAVVTTETEAAVVSAVVTTETAVIDITGVSFKEFKDKLRPMTVAELLKAVDAVKVNRWDKITNEPIKKMRLIMELKAYYYPEKVKAVTPREAAPVSPWKAITTEKLIAAAESNKIIYKPTENEGILRMRIIMGLKAAKVAPETIR